MRNFLIILYLTLLSCYASAQTAVAYQYDAVGNRISSSLYVRSMDLQSEEDYAVSRAEWQISVYPNPTNGHLILKILNFTDNHDCDLAIYTISGHEVLTKKVSSANTELDLSSYSNGVYVIAYSLTVRQ